MRIRDPMPLFDHGSGKEKLGSGIKKNPRSATVIFKSISIFHSYSCAKYVLTE
jgi:hypothetical protein